jgi:hypothetical protein
MEASSHAPPITRGVCDSRMSQTAQSPRILGQRIRLPIADSDPIPTRPTLREFPVGLNDIS